MMFILYKNWKACAGFIIQYRLCFHQFCKLDYYIIRRENISVDKKVKLFVINCFF
jgi:hypothetical protein